MHPQSQQLTQQLPAEKRTNPCTAQPTQPAALNSLPWCHSPSPCTGPSPPAACAPAPRCRWRCEAPPPRAWLRRRPRRRCSPCPPASALSWCPAGGWCSERLRAPWHPPPRREPASGLAAAAAVAAADGAAPPPSPTNRRRSSEGGSRGCTFVEVADGRVSRVHAVVRWDALHQHAVLEVSTIWAASCESLIDVGCQS